MNKVALVAIFVCALSAALFFLNASIKTRHAPGASTSFSFIIKDGRLLGGEADVRVIEGDTVTLLVASDVSDELHLHGYNLMTRLTAGTSSRLTFVARKSGHFEFELEERGTPLGSISVQPR